MVLVRADDVHHIENRRLACNTERVRTSPPSSCTHQHPISEEKNRLGRNSKETKIKEISTKSANLITASPHDSVDGCMQKMLSKDIRHLPLLDDEGKVVGILSIKDLVKATVQHQEETIKILSDFALGRGGHFGSD